MGEDDIAGKNNLLRRSSVKSNGFKTVCLGWLILELMQGSMSETQSAGLLCYRLGMRVRSGAKEFFE
jgi:hypothetical protein